MKHIRRHFMTAGLLGGLCLSSTACAVRYVVLEPEDPAARLQAPVIAHVVNPVVDDPAELVAFRIRIIAPKDSSLILVLSPPPPSLTAAMVLGAPPTRCGTAGQQAERTALRLCRLKDTSFVVSDSTFLATVEYAPGNNPFNVKRPVKVHRHRGVKELIIPAGRDTTLHLAVAIKDPDFDYERSRFGVDLSWQTLEGGDKKNPRVMRSLYERASFRRVNYRWTPVLAGLALAVVAGSTQR